MRVRPRVRLAALAIVCLCLIPPGAAAQGTATITGTITDLTTGNPLSSPVDPLLSVRVIACGEASGCVWSNPTDSAGGYTIPSLEPGTYFLRTENPSTHVPELFDDIACVAADCRAIEGTPVILDGGETRTIDFALSPGGVISGTVTNAATTAPLTVVVSVFNAQTSLVSSVLTTPSGTYEIRGLPSGSSFVTVTDGSGRFRPRLARGGDCPLDNCRIASGTPIAVTAGAVTSVNEALSPAPAGVIAGAVSDDAGGVPQVTVFAFDGDRRVGAAQTDGSGHYKVGGLAPGQYTVRTLVNSSSPLADQSFEATVGVDTTTVVNFSLTRGASISGDLIAPPGVTIKYGAAHGAAILTIGVLAFDSSGRFARAAEIILADPLSTAPARYVIRGLAAGRYLYGSTTSCQCSRADTRRADSFRGTSSDSGRA